MDRQYACCCGLDVHEQTVVACLISPVGGVGQTKTIRTFGTTTDELDALADWLAEAGCTHVAMESTGVYWKPVYNRLDGRFTIIVANAQRIKIMPGRKTDVKDCEWIADLLQHGLLTASFIPSQAQRELRDLTRTRAALIDIQAFIAESPFVVMATSGRDGRSDASPKGGKPGFVRILDDRHLLVPDIAGNRLFQSYLNMDENPHVGRVFFIPGLLEVVRVNGRVSIVSKEDLDRHGVKNAVYNADITRHLEQHPEPVRPPRRVGPSPGRSALAGSGDRSQPGRRLRVQAQPFRRAHRYGAGQGQRATGQADAHQG